MTDSAFSEVPLPRLSKSQREVLEMLYDRPRETHDQTAKGWVSGITAASLVRRRLAMRVRLVTDCVSITPAGRAVVEVFRFRENNSPLPRKTN